MQSVDRMTEKRKLEPPLKLDLSFVEALSRFVTTDPKEVEDNIAKAKAKRPPRDGASRRPERPKRRELKKG